MLVPVWGCFRHVGVVPENANGASRLNQRWGLGHVSALGRGCSGKGVGETDRIWGMVQRSGDWGERAKGRIGICYSSGDGERLRIGACYSSGDGEKGVGGE